MKRILLALFAVLAVFSIAACNKDKEGTLNMAIHYYSASGGFQFITYQKDAEYESTVDGKRYTKGDLLPVWAAIGDKLNINFVDKAKTSNQNTNEQWAELVATSFEGVDFVNSTGTNIAIEGQNGHFVDLGKYLDRMPNLDKFLKDNPSVKVSLTAGDGGIYFTPYFDGLNEIEQMFMARIDWIETICDGTTAGDADAAVSISYTPIVTSKNYKVQVATSATVTREVTKQNQTNIITQLKALGSSATGAQFLSTFRDYLTAQYANQGYAKKSHIFAGTDASYDTDELIALMYVIKSNPELITANSTNKISVPSELNIMFPRTSQGSRILNLLRATEMFGVRGAHSRHKWMYIDANDKVRDSRTEEKTVDAVDTINLLFRDGLIIPEPDKLNGTNDTDWMLTLQRQQANAFMTYDFNATQTAIGHSGANGGPKIDPNYKFEAILPPVVDWLANGKYFHFTESVRSVKADAWGLTKNILSDENNLKKALELIDQLYDYSSPDSVGNIHLYGPSSWTDGTYTYNGEEVPKLVDKAMTEMATLTGGNHIDYLRAYVGCTLPIGHVRGMGLEYQTLSPQGKESIERINTAVVAGTFKLAGVCPEAATNPWYQISPTNFPLTKEDNDGMALQKIHDPLWADSAVKTIVMRGLTGSKGATNPLYVDYAAYRAVWISADSKNLYDLFWYTPYNAAYQRAKA